MYRTAGLYIVGSWLIIQVADIFFPAWSIPETAIRYLIIAAAACFPIALLFGWRYDITPQGIVRTEPATAAETFDLKLQRADYLLLAALLAVGLAVLASSASKIQEEIASSSTGGPIVERLDKSIAVLPFRNLDINPETGFFSDGVTEEILHRLSTLGTLHVLASTSSFVFRDSQETPADISEALGVRFLLLGSVRRDQDNLRITARLLDQTGFQVWSDIYDRELTSVFAIQSEIASKVASEIAREIIPVQQLPAGRTTTNMEAYSLYLAGKAYQDARTPDWKQKASDAYSRAIELDEGFAPPYAGIAITMTVNTGPGPQWEEALGFTERALELDPELPEALAAHGFILAATGDARRGLEHLERALELDPSLAIAYGWIVLPLRELGRDAEALARLRRGVEVDPLNPVLVRNLALLHESNTGNFERAEQLLLRLTRIPEPPARAFHWLSQLYESWGRIPQAIETAKQLIRLQGRETDPAVFSRLAIGYAGLGLESTADYWLDVYTRVTDEPYPIDDYYRIFKILSDASPLLAQLARMEADDVFTEGEDQAYYCSSAGLAYIQVGQFEKGVTRLEQGLGIYRRQLQPDTPAGSVDLALFAQYWDDRDIWQFAPRLAYAYRQVGRPEAAENLLQALGRLYWAADMPPAQVPAAWEAFALYKALTGDAAAAHDALETAVELGWSNYREVSNDIAWRETVETAEFRALLERVKTDVDRQKEIVAAEDAEDDIRDVVERLIAE